MEFMLIVSLWDITHVLSSWFSLDLAEALAVSICVDSSTAGTPWMSHRITTDIVSDRLSASIVCQAYKLYINKTSDVLAIWWKFCKYKSCFGCRRARQRNLSESFCERCWQHFLLHVSHLAYESENTRPCCGQPPSYLSAKELTHAQLPIGDYEAILGDTVLYWPKSHLYIYCRIAFPCYLVIVT